MGLFDDLYKRPLPSGDFGATTLPPIPTATETTTAEHPFVSLLKTLLAPTSTAHSTTGGTDFGSLISALRTVPHLGIGGSAITPDNPTGDPRNAFGSGFFKTGAERAAIEQSRGAVGSFGDITPRTPEQIVAHYSPAPEATNKSARNLDWPFLYNQMLSTRQRLDPTKSPISSFRKIQGDLFPFSIGS